MMIKSVLLTSIGLVSIAQALIYAATGGRIIECPWDAKSTDFDMITHITRNRLDWPDLHFDQTSGSMEALVLPEYFWKDLLTPAQTVEIILNPKLRPMLLKAKKFWREIEKEKHGLKARQKLFGIGTRHARKAIERKLGHFQSHLKDVDPLMAGDQAEQVIEAIPPETYKHTSPLLAILSRRFKATQKNVAKLFGFTLKGLKAAVPYIIPVVMTVLRLIVTALITGALSMGGLGMMGSLVGMGGLFGSGSKSAAASTAIPSMGPFYIAQVLLSLLEQHPILDHFIGHRVRLLVAELQRVMDFLRARMQRTDQKIAKFNKNRKMAAKANLLRRQNRPVVPSTRRLPNKDHSTDDDGFGSPARTSRDSSSSGEKRSSIRISTKGSSSKRKSGRSSRRKRVQRV